VTLLFVHAQSLTQLQSDVEIRTALKGNTISVPDAVAMHRRVDLLCLRGLGTRSAGVSTLATHRASSNVVRRHQTR
jgi:hypothetical protein